MNKLKKGFTLIELLVVIAIIGILATTLAPKLREQLAKAKNAQVIAALGVVRTTTDIVVLEKLIALPDNATVQEYNLKFADIRSRLGSKVLKIVQRPHPSASSYLETKIKIGGGKNTTTGATIYGGEIFLAKQKYHPAKNGNAAYWGTPSIFSDNSGSFKIFVNDIGDYRIILTNEASNESAATKYGLEGKRWDSY